MPTTTLHFGKAGVEDLEIGTGTFSVRTSDGREITLNKINLSSFIAPLAIDKAIYFTDGNNVGQDSSFTYDTDTKDMILAGGQLKVGGSGAADRTLHVAEAGAVQIRIENESASAGNVGLEWAINGAVDWNLSAVDNENDNLVLSAGSAVATTPHFAWFRNTHACAIGSKTLNAFCHQGLTIDQATDTNHIIDFKASGLVSHGITNFAEADTYGYITQISGAGNGGCVLTGITEGIPAVSLTGLATSETTTSSDAAAACVTANAFLKSGAGTGALASGANAFAVANDATTVLIVKGDGDVHNSGGSTSMTTYDDFDDIKLLQTVKGVMDVSYRNTLGEWIGEHTELLQRTGVIRRDEGDTWFISQRGWRGLVIDAMRQLAARVDYLEQQVNAA